MNELLLLTQAVICALFVFLTWRYARERLYTLITLFLLLIAIAGGKIVYLFGHPTNTGNIFYASVFLATYFLIERLGRKEGIYSIWVSVVAIAFFFMLMQTVVGYVGSAVTANLNNALEIAFAPFSRIAVASLVAFVLSQNLNVYLYLYLKKRWNGARLWLRANITNVLAQIVDSIVFFTVAFWGVVAPGNIGEIILTGFLIKVIFVAFTSSLLYLNRVELEDGHEYVKISVR